MPPRKTTDFGALFESLVEDLRIQVAASVDQTIADLSRRIARIERRLDQLDPENASVEPKNARRVCALCERGAVARGMCSAHYQQWRYRERKRSLAQRVEGLDGKTADPSILEATTLLNPRREIAADN